MSMTEGEALEYLRNLSGRTGASVEQSDVQRLTQTDGDDTGRLQAAYESQYARRGASQTEGSGTDSQDLMRGGYGSGRDENQGGAPASGGRQSGGSPSGGRPGGVAPSQAWNAAGAAPAASVDPFPSWYKDLMQSQVAQQQAERAAQQQKADALYGQLDTRAKQGLQINASDPIIKGQVDAFSAQGERARRNYLSDIAERSGPYANVRGEQRMTAEKLGQGTSAFQAELLGRELGARRDEIAQALSAQGAMLSGDQTRNLQAQLAQMDQAIKEAGIGMQGRGLDLQRDLGFSDLALRDKLGMGGLALQGRGLDIQRELGLGGLALTGRGQDMSMDQFLRELALREWIAGDNSDRAWAGR